MWELLFQVLGVLIGGWAGAYLYGRARRRRAAAAFTAGRDAIFPGWVVGSRSYCRAPGGLLVLTQDGIYHVVDRGMPVTRHDLPIDRLDVVAVRRGTRADHKQMPADWLVIECLDEDEKVWIACHEGEMRFVEQAFARSSRPPQSTLP